ncbi:hypothetical protein Gotur_013747 [Gossypium turneri]
MEKHVSVFTLAFLQNTSILLLCTLQIM